MVNLEGFTDTPPNLEGFSSEAPKGASSFGTMDDAIQGLKEGTTGTLAYMGDMLSAPVKVGAQALLSIGGKIAEPSRSLQDTWSTAGEAVNETFPSFADMERKRGTMKEKNTAYDFGMWPLEKVGQGIEWAAEKTGNVFGPDAQGAVNIGLNIGGLGVGAVAGKGIASLVKKQKAATPDMKATALDEKLETKQTQGSFPPIDPKMLKEAQLTVDDAPMPPGQRSMNPYGIKNDLPTIPVIPENAGSIRPPQPRDLNFPQINEGSLLKSEGSSVPLPPGNRPLPPEINLNQNLPIGTGIEKPSALPPKQPPNLGLPEIQPEGVPQAMGQEFPRPPGERSPGVTPDNWYDMAGLDRLTEPRTQAGRAADAELGAKVWEEGKDPSAPKTVKRSRQSGGIDIDLLTFGQANRIANLVKESPEILKASADLAKQQQQERVARTILGNDEGYRVNIDTPEKVLAALPDARDLTTVERIRGGTITAGAGRMAANTDHPLIKYMRDTVRSAYRGTEQVMRERVTDANQLGSTWERLSKQERGEVWQAVQVATKHKAALTDTDLTAYTPNQIKAIQQIQEMQVSLYNDIKTSRDAAGLKTPEFSPGMPLIMKGDWSSIVKYKDAEGNWKPIGFIGADLRWQHNKQVEAIRGKYGTSVKIERLNQKPGSLLPNSMGNTKALLEALVKNDPSLEPLARELQQIQDSIAHRSYGTMMQAEGTLAKAWGGEGNKPWKDIETNAAEGMKSYLKWYEDQVLTHKLMTVENQMDGLYKNPLMDEHHNAVAYAQDYMRNATGMGVNDFGRALNTVVDIIPKALGIGPTKVTQGFHELSKRLGQKTMGFFNLPFSGIQLLQVPVSAWPEAVGLARNADLAQAAAHGQFAKGIQDMLVLGNEAIGGKPSPDPFRRSMFDFAAKNGLLDFSEFADVNKVTQSKAGKAFDQVADINRTIPEVMTRPLVFFTLARVLKESGKLPDSEVLQTAYNKTQTTMIDYQPYEQPLMYSKMGKVGKLAGNLKTFAHGYTAQQAHAVTEAFKGNPEKIAMMIAGGALLTGIKGTPFYQDLDAIFQTISGIVGKRKTISEVALDELPGWQRNGFLSDVTNINFQSRLGTANLVPDNAADAVSPYMSMLGNMAVATGELIDNPNRITGERALKELAPNSMRGLVEYLGTRGPKDQSLNKEGQVDYPRDEFDWKLRKYGLTSMQEAETKERLYNKTLSELSDKDARTRLMLEMKRGFLSDKGYGATREFADKRKKWLDRGGDPNTLIPTITEYLQESKKTTKQRREGVPSTYTGVKKYQNYND